MQKITAFIKVHMHVWITAIFFCVLLYIYYFRGGFFVLGGEGNYWLDFRIYLRNTGESWIDYGTGIISSSINSIFSYPYIFSLISNAQLKSFLLISITYLMPFITTYFLLIRLDGKAKKIAFFVSLFFVVNPFSVNLLNALNPWGVHILFMYPLFFLVIYTFFDDSIKLFIFSGITSLFFAYTLTNPPHLLLFSIFISILIFIAQIIKQQQFEFIDFIKKNIIVYSAYIFYNIWWFVHWIVAFPSINQFYTFKFAKQWLSTVSSDSTLIFNDLFSFNWLTPKFIDYNFFSFFYNTPFVTLILFIPFALIVYWIINEKEQLRDRKIVFTILGFLIITTLFLKATNPPLRNFMLFCFDHIPFCYIYKTAPEKFGVPFVFLSTLILFFVLKSTKNKLTHFFFYGYVCVMLIPFLTGNFIPNTVTDAGPKYATRRFKDLEEFKLFRKRISDEKQNIRLLSYPTGANYQVKMHNYDNMYYTGLDPVLMNIPQTYIADHMGVNMWPLFHTLDRPIHQKLLALYSIKYIHLNKRLVSWFGNPAGMTVDEIEKLLRKKYKFVERFGQIELFENLEYLPLLYGPLKPIIADSDKEIQSLLSQIPINSRPVFFPRSIGPKLVKTLEENSKTNKASIHFKKISSTKYRVLLQDAKGIMPLVLNESFHTLWRVYAVPIEYPKDQNQFISKNILGTTQNENLPKGHFYETIIHSQALPDTVHYKVNGYANAWIIDITQVCDLKQNACLKNADGTHNVSLVIEFSPQQILRVTMAISAILVTISLLFIGANFLKKYGPK